MHGPRGNADPVDSVRRDAKDGAYHCPQCDTPFTRRSNLRRHFQIHTRNALLKCDNCDEEYATKQELQHHAATCYSLSWNHTDDRTFRGMDNTLRNDLPSDPALAPGQSMNTYLYGGNYASPATLFPNFDAPDSRYPGSYQDLGLMSPLASPIGVLPSHTSNYDGNLNLSTLNGTVPPRRPSTSSSSSSGSSPYNSSTQSVASNTFFPVFPPTEKPGAFGWTGVTPSPPISPIDEPVYSRKQVKDMIDVVSECLIDTMENVMTRSQPPSLGMPYETSIESQLVHSIRDAGFRQTVISEAIPRVFYKIHTRGNDAKQ